MTYYINVNQYDKDQIINEIFDNNTFRKIAKAKDIICNMIIKIAFSHVRVCNIMQAHKQFCICHVTGDLLYYQNYIRLCNTIFSQKHETHI